MTSPEVTNEKGLTSPNASGWDDYIVFSEKYDKDRMGTWDDRIGVLLLFATVFAAVLTPFLVPVSALLSPDPMAGTNARLDQIILLLQNSTAKQTRTDTAPFVPRASVVSVNVLWFGSLGLSLFAALFSILAKQWLRAYAPSTSGTPRERARNQQQLLTAFDAWHVGAVIEAMPVVLHLSLVLFLTGLVVYLWTLNHIVAGFATGIVGVTFLAYAVVFLLPLFSTTCPYYNPVLRQRKKKQWDEGDSEEPPESGESPDHLDVKCMTWLLRQSTTAQHYANTIHTVADIPVRILYDYRVSSEDIELVVSRIREEWQRLNPYKLDEFFLSKYELLLRAIVKILQSRNARPQPLPELRVALSLGAQMSDRSRHSNYRLRDEPSAKAAAIAVLSLDLTFFALLKDYSQMKTTLSEERHLGEDMSSWSERYSSVGLPSQVLLMDSLAVCFVGLPPLSSPGGPNEAGWFKNLLALIFHTLTKSKGAIENDEATPEIKELHLAAAHALFCALFDISKTSNTAEYEAHFRYTSVSVDDFLRPSFCCLLDPKNGWRAWTVNNSDALSLIAMIFSEWVDGLLEAMMYDSDADLTSPSLDMAAQWLWAALAEDVDIRALEDPVKKNLSDVWFWASYYNGLQDGLVFIQSVSRDVRPLLHIMRCPLTVASIETGKAAQNVLAVLGIIYRSDASSVARTFQEAEGVGILWPALEDAWKNIDHLRSIQSWDSFWHVVCVLAAHFTALIPIATNDDRALIGSQARETVTAFHCGCRLLEKTQDLFMVMMRDEKTKYVTLLEWHINVSSKILPPLYTLTSELEDCVDSWKKAYRGLAILRSLTVDPYKPFQDQLLELWSLLSDRFGNIEDGFSDEEDAPHDPMGGSSGLEAADGPDDSDDGLSNAEGGLGPGNLQAEGGAVDPDHEGGPDNLQARGGARGPVPEGGEKDGEGGPSSDHEGGLYFFQGNPNSAGGGPSDGYVGGAPSA